MPVLMALAVSSLPSAATKGAAARVREPTLTERRAAEEAAAMEKEKERAQRRVRGKVKEKQMHTNSRKLGRNAPQAARAGRWGPLGLGLIRMFIYFLANVFFATFGVSQAAFVAPCRSNVKVFRQMSRHVATFD